MGCRPALCRGPEAGPPSQPRSVRSGMSRTPGRCPAGPCRLSLASGASGRRGKPPSATRGGGPGAEDLALQCSAGLSLGRGPGPRGLSNPPPPPRPGLRARAGVISPEPRSPAARGPASPHPAPTPAPAGGWRLTPAPAPPETHLLRGRQLHPQSFPGPPGWLYRPSRRAARRASDREPPPAPAPASTAQPTGPPGATEALEEAPPPPPPRRLPGGLGTRSSNAWLRRHRRAEVPSRPQATALRLGAAGGGPGRGPRPPAAPPAAPAPGPAQPGSPGATGAFRGPVPAPPPAPTPWVLPAAGSAPPGPCCLLPSQPCPDPQSPRGLTPAPPPAPHEDHSAASTPPRPWGWRAAARGDLTAPRSFPGSPPGSSRTPGPASGWVSARQHPACILLRAHPGLSASKSSRETGAQPRRVRTGKRAGGPPGRGRGKPREASPLCSLYSPRSPSRGGNSTPT